MSHLRYRKERFQSKWAQSTQDIDVVLLLGAEQFWVDGSWLLEMTDVHAVLDVTYVHLVSSLIINLLLNSHTLVKLHTD